jgi:chemotaxis protein MotA
MPFIIGAITVIVCTLGGYAAMGGKLYVLWQPFEVVIICGAALGAAIIGNGVGGVKHMFADFKKTLAKSKYNGAAYIELLGMLFVVFKSARSKGWLSLESHIENPQESELFKQFPIFHGNHHAMTFFCDYLRIISLGSENPHEIEALMDEEIDTMKEEMTHSSHAMQTMADGMPALGIVAAVLGVIKTMGSISEPPEVLGKLIGGALVGTFLGVWISYGFLAPAATSMKTRVDEEVKYYQCIKAGLLAYLQGCAPMIAVEFARKTLREDVRPSFQEVDTAMQSLPSA